MEILATKSTTAVATNFYDTAYAAAQTDIRRPVCMTPCMADFEAGMHELSFESRDDQERKSTAEVQIDEQTKAIRHAMGRTEATGFGQTAGTILAGVGIALLVTGGAMLGAAAAGDEYEVDHRLHKVGIMTTVAGGVTLAFSIPTLVLTRPIRQDGSTTTISQ